MSEVICQSMTFSASANPIVYQGATPIFIDSELDTWNMCPKHLEIAIKDRILKGKKPKAIIPVHLYGMPAKMDEILAIANQYEITVIEDAAEGDALLEKLWAHATQEKFVWVQDWAPGGLIMWDNRAVMHSRRPFTPPRRIMASIGASTCGGSKK